MFDCMTIQAVGSDSGYRTIKQELYFTWHWKC